nr:hypothetical protein [Sphingomonas folli]
MLMHARFSDPRASSDLRRAALSADAANAPEPFDEARDGGVTGGLRYLEMELPIKDIHAIIVLLVGLHLRSHSFKPLYLPRVDLDSRDGNDLTFEDATTFNPFTRDSPFLPSDIVPATLPRDQIARDLQGNQSFTHHGSTDLELIR